MTNADLLSSAHFVELTQGSGLSIDTIEQRGYRTVTASGLAALGFSKGQQLAGLLCPVWGVDKPGPGRKAEPAGYQIKPDKPRLNTSGKPRKYEFAWGQKVRLDVPPQCLDRLIDTDCPVWITEGAKKADRMAQEGLCVIGLLGVWNWLGKQGFGGAFELSDWRAFSRARQFFLAFDSDYRTNPKVMAALTDLRDMLERNGGKVSFVNIPAALGGGKMGADDFFQMGGTVDDLMGSVTFDPVNEIDDTSGNYALPYDQTDLGNAERFIEMYGADIRWVTAWKQWLVWNGKRWAVDELGGQPVMSKVAAFVKGLKEEALLIEDKDQKAKAYKHAMTAQSGNSLREITRIAQSMVAVTPDDLDKNGWLINCMNGVVDLKEGKLLPHDRSHLMTKMIPANFDENAEAPNCPTWIAFNKSVFNDSRPLCRYIWKAMGYSLTDDIREKCFFFLYGSGDNGKSVFTDLLSHIMGDYWKNVPVETFMSKKFESSGSSEIARLKGARVVTATESEDNKRLDEALIKRATGGDTLTAAMKYGQHFDFPFNSKIWMSGNHRPKIGMDKATWNRVALVPFTVTFTPEQQDKELRSKLRAEVDGIFTWMVAGCIKWQAEGLIKPREVVEAIENYRAEMDTLGHFLEDRTEVDAFGEITGSAFYTAYKDWCKATSEYTMTSTAFGRKLSERGMTKGRRETGVYYPGLRIINGASSSFDD